jgi:hypothetical protein
MTQTSDRVKIRFRLVQDEDEYPPFAVESVWAIKQPTGSYRIDNIPFFTRDATLGDTIAATEDEEGLWFSETIRPSTSSLLRVILFDDDRTDELCNRLVALGCTVESFRSHHLVAVNVPPSTTLSPVQDYLRDQAREGWLDYEEPILRH